MKTPLQFFYAHAGYSYLPPEKPSEGRRRCARILAEAERKANDAGYQFKWEIDPDGDSSDFSDESPPWRLWECTMRDRTGRISELLCGIDFGRDGEPWGDPYKRVVEAELASQVFTSLEGKQ